MSAIPIETTRHKVARGTVEANGRLQVACRFDEDTFDGVNRLAHAHNISFASMIRVLVCESLNRRKAWAE